MYWLKFRQYALVFVFLFCSTPAFSDSKCWDKKAPPGSKSRSFMLAMGANTGEVKMADADAEAFANVLGHWFKIPEDHICKRTAVNEEEFQSSLEELKKLSVPKDRVFIYFSGHGMQIRDASGKLTDRDCVDEAFITVDGLRVTDDFFVDTVNDMQAENIYIFLDVCFAGGMVRGDEKCSGMKSKIHPDSDDVDMEQELPRKCPLDKSFKNLKGILYAAAGELADAWEIKGKGGYFTRTFLNNFREYVKKHGGTDKDPAVLLDTVFQMTRTKMLSVTHENCRQIPKRMQN